MRQQFSVYEVEEPPVAHGEEFLPLPAIGLALVGLRMLDIVLERCSPVLPTEGADQRGRERLAHSLGGFAVTLLLRVEDAKEQNPRQLRYVLQRARTIRAAHDVTDGFYVCGERARRLDLASLFRGVVCSGWHHLEPSTDSDMIR